jgi:hypothetical protein
MPRVRGPLFSLEASGTLGKSLTFVQHGEKSTVRRAQLKAPPPSVWQSQQRARVKNIKLAYRTLTPIQKNQWRIAGAPLKINGWCMFWRAYTLQNIAPPNLPTPP